MAAEVNSYDYHAFATSSGPHHVSESSLDRDPPSELEVRFIAYYLPQFHRIEENDVAWGTGFTEWNNVVRATARFDGHLQPRLPADLGFYDLSDEENLRKQISLARRAGLFGFCFHYYWFSGKQVLEKPIQAFLTDETMDIPFCINWANENWTRRWDGADHEVILKQDYSADDPEKFASTIAPILNDARYIHVNGRPLLMIYRPNLIPDPKTFMDRVAFRLAESGICRPYFVMPDAEGNDPDTIPVDGLAGFPPHPFGAYSGNIRPWLRLFDKDYIGWVVEYEKAIMVGLHRLGIHKSYFPGVCPGWDNEARRPRRGFTLLGSNPRTYGKWLTIAARHVQNRSQDERLVFINAWNEWGEGAYLEPDRHTGYAYLVQTRSVLDHLKFPSKSQDIDFRSGLRKSYRNYLVAKTISVNRKIKNWLSIHFDQIF